MSNDTKLWIVRVAVASFIVFDLYALTKMQAQAYSGSVGKWFWVLIASVVVSIPLFLYYYYLRSRRWDENNSAQKIELETLATVYRQKREDRQKNKPGN